MRLPHPVPELPVADHQLHAERKARGALIAQKPRTAPYNLREFTAQDPDGNRIRVFYDLGGQGR